MPFQLTPARRLQVEADRVQAILEKQENSDAVWQEDGFIAYLASVGLTYTSPELTTLRAELLARGVITVS